MGSGLRHPLRRLCCCLMSSNCFDHEGYHQSQQAKALPMIPRAKAPRFACDGHPFNRDGGNQSQQEANVPVTGHDQWDWSRPRDGPRCLSTDHFSACWDWSHINTGQHPPSVSPVSTQPSLRLIIYLVEASPIFQSLHSATTHTNVVY